MGLVPLSNFITRQPVEKLAEINRIDQKRYFDIKAGVLPGLSRSETDAAGVEKDILINANERIAFLTRYLEANPLPPGVSWEWTGDQEDEAESQAFLSKAFIAALALMFIILLAQFNSFFNSFIVLLAVVLSTVGVLIGMLVMQQAFSIIMTGTGIVALAGIVVNNNIVLIDTYQELSRYMPRIEAIIRTAEQRIRPVLLTTITTMAGLAPMMFGLSLDFINGGYSIDSPTALWWKATGHGGGIRAGYRDGSHLAAYPLFVGRALLGGYLYRLDRAGADRARRVPASRYCARLGAQSHGKTPQTTRNYLG
jgi:multidrug efflux pump